MPKQITKESAAWREVACRIAQRDISFVYGICFVLTNMRMVGVIDDGMYHIMDGRIGDTFDEKDTSAWVCDGTSSYLFPHSETDERVLLCLFLALLAEDEGN